MDTKSSSDESDKGKHSSRNFEGSVMTDADGLVVVLGLDSILLLL
jgi:hypothetical protein